MQHPSSWSINRECRKVIIDFGKSLHAGAFQAIRDYPETRTRPDVQHKGNLNAITILPRPQPSRPAKRIFFIFRPIDDIVSPQTIRTSQIDGGHNRLTYNTLWISIKQGLLSLAACRINIKSQQKQTTGRPKMAHSMPIGYSRPVR